MALSLRAVRYTALAYNLVSESATLFWNLTYIIPLIAVMFQTSLLSAKLSMTWDEVKAVSDGNFRGQNPPMNPKRKATLRHQLGALAILSIFLLAVYISASSSGGDLPLLTRGLAPLLIAVYLALVGFPGIDHANRIQDHMAMRVDRNPESAANYDRMHHITQGVTGTMYSGFLIFVTASIFGMLPDSMGMWIIASALMRGWEVFATCTTTYFYLLPAKKLQALRTKMSGGEKKPTPAHRRTNSAAKSSKLGSGNNAKSGAGAAAATYGVGQAASGAATSFTVPSKSNSTASLGFSTGNTGSPGFGSTTQASRLAGIEPQSSFSSFNSQTPLKPQGSSSTFTASAHSTPGFVPRPVPTPSVHLDPFPDMDITDAGTESRSPGSEPNAPPVVAHFTPASAPIARPDYAIPPSRSLPEGVDPKDLPPGSFV